MYLSLERIWILNSSLNKSNCLVCFNKNVFIRKNDSFIFSSILVDNVFHITPISLYLLLKIIKSHLRGKYLAIIKLIYGIYA